MRTTALLLLAFAACAGPTDPAMRTDGDWSLEATALPNCRLVALLHLSGPADDFTGSADLGMAHRTPDGMVSRDGLGVPVEGDAAGVRVGGYELHIMQRGPEKMGGAWECDGQTGTWQMARHELTTLSIR